MPSFVLRVIRQRLPQLRWAIQPRSITTVGPALELKILKLISVRREEKGLDVNNQLLDVASIDELRTRALADARPIAIQRVGMATRRPRSIAVHRYVLARADGVCEGCRCIAPFRTRAMAPCLEPHHTTRLADEGPDHPSSVIALCPTCHKRVHHSHDGDAYNQALVRKLRRLEQRMSSR